MSNKRADSEPRGRAGFSFGRNWQDFVRTKFNEERVEISQKHLLEFLEVRDLAGKSFLDLGCGSGLHSLAAYRAGATRIVSVDVDPLSVRTTQSLRERAGSPSHWQIVEGSVLDSKLMSRLEPADLVYSWGVLHHTGDIWTAFRNATGCIRPGGLFYVALYEKTAESDYWIATKQKYNRSSRPVQLAMELHYVYHWFLRGRGPRQLVSSLRYMLSYRRSRGMAFWTDVRDWLGGWPYEPVTPQEVTDFCARLPGLRMQKVKTGQANVEYLIARATG